MSLVPFKFSGTLLSKFVYNTCMLVARKAIHKTACLNKIVKCCIRKLQCIKVTHFLFCCISVDVVLVSCALCINLIHK
jgi:hypothetical protein